MRADAGPGKPKVKVRKPTVVKAPAGDVASSGGNYGTKRAAPTVKRELKAIRVRQTQVKDTKAGADLKRGAGVANGAVRQLAADTVKASNRGVRPHPALLKNLAKAGLVKSYDGYAVANDANKVASIGDKLLSGKLTIGAVRAAEKAANAAGHGLASVPGFSSMESEIPGSKGGPQASRALTEGVDIAANAIPSVYVPLRDAARGHVGKAAGEVTQPFKQVYKHPLASLNKRPLTTMLMFSGVEGALGHGLGKTLRTIPTKTTRRLASVDRAPKTHPNVAATLPRQYSGDLFVKGAQVAREKVKVRRAAKKNQSAPVVRMSEADIKRRVDHEAQVQRIVQSQHEHKVDVGVRKAVGRKPTAAHVLAAKGITNGTKADLAKYLEEVKAARAGLTAHDDIVANERLQTQIEHGLANHPADHVLQQEARAYSDFRLPTEGDVVAHELVKPAEAEQARYAGAAVRQGATVASKRTAVAAGKQAREGARKVKVRARQDVVRADQQVAAALADARVSNVRVKGSPALQAAEKARSQAVAHLASLRRKGLSESNRDVQRAEAVARKASSRLTAQAERERQGALRAESSAKGRAAVLSRNVGGRAGGYGVEQASLAVDRAAANVRKSRGGVPPSEADALRRSLAARDDAAAAHAEAVRGARVAVRQAEARVKAEQGRIGGVHPKEADALLNAISERDAIRVSRSEAVGAHKAATVVHRAAKAAPFADESLKPVTVADVRAARGPGAIEPAFISDAGVQRGISPLPSKRPTIAVKHKTAGEAVRKGIINADPATLYEQARTSQSLVDSAKAREQLIEKWGFRSESGEVDNFKTQSAAETHAHDQRGNTGVAWEPIQRQDGSYAVIPHTVAQRLRGHEERISQHPVVAAYGRQWRRNVLSSSPKWLLQNVTEGTLRSGVSRAGPVSWATAHMAERALGRKDPQALEQFRAAARSGGLNKVADRAQQERLATEELGNGVTKAALAVRNAKGVRQGVNALGGLYRAWTTLVFHHLNGRIETDLFQKAMVGRVLRDHPLMADSLLKIGPKAIEQAAEGLRNTDTQFEFALQLRDMFGRYGGWGPKMQQGIAQYTPFIAWSLNALRFCYLVLPRDHPVLTGLLASANQATESWRKSHGLYLDITGKTPGQRPPWQMGGIPVKGGINRWVSGGTPFGLLANDSGTPVGAVSNLVIPQISEALNNAAGKDWLGNPLSKGTNNGVRDMEAFFTSLGLGVVPFGNDVVKVTGVRPPNVSDHSHQHKSGIGQINPFRVTPNSSKKSGSSKGGWDAPSTSKGSGWDSPTSTKGGWG